LRSPNAIDPTRRKCSSASLHLRDGLAVFALTSSRPKKGVFFPHTTYAVVRWCDKRLPNAWGGKYSGLMELFRDWSPWLACSQCLEDLGNVDTPQLHPLTQLYRDGELLVSISPGDKAWSPGEKTETPVQNRRTSEPVRKSARKNPGRNEPCSWGSGLKFKKCCGRAI
jgi:hypothetical protein